MTNNTDEEIGYYLFSWKCLTDSQAEWLDTLPDEERDEAQDKLLAAFDDTLQDRIDHVIGILEEAKRNFASVTDFIFIDNDEALCFLIATKDKSIIENLLSDPTAIAQKRTKEDHDNRNCVYRMYDDNRGSLSGPSLKLNLP